MVQENKGNGEKFLTGKFVVISAVSFILRLGMAVMLTAVPLYDLSIGFSKTSAGIYAAINKASWRRASSIASAPIMKANPPRPKRR